MGGWASGHTKRALCTQRDAVKGRKHWTCYSADELEAIVLSEVTGSQGANAGGSFYMRPLEEQIYRQEVGGGGCRGKGAGHPCEWHRAPG